MKDSSNYQQSASLRNYTKDKQQKVPQSEYKPPLNSSQQQIMDLNQVVAQQLQQQANAQGHHQKSLTLTNPTIQIQGSLIIQAPQQLQHDLDQQQYQSHHQQKQ